MQFFYEKDANLTHLANRTIGIIGYGNQGRAQALNLRDSGLTVIIGTQRDTTWDQALADGFSVHSVSEVAEKADVVSLLIPDEVAPEVFDSEIRMHMKKGKTLNFATGYNVAFGLIDLPAEIDVVMVAPRMIGAGVRERYESEQGFPSFIAVHQDVSGQARATVLALAKGIGSTRVGVVEVSMREEAIMDLFTEQGTGPLIGRCLMAGYQVLVDAGLPPEAVLLELYVSGELATTFQAMADYGILAQMRLHSPTSQYGSMTRSASLNMEPFFAHLQKVLDDIQSSVFVKEWAKEKEAGYPTLKMLREGAKMLPMFAEEKRLLKALHRPGANSNTRSK